MRDNLEEKPLGRYKFVSILLQLNYDKTMTSRQTYNLLDWFGDIGGLTDFLLYAAKLFLMPFSIFSRESFLLQKLFRIQTKEKQ